MSDKPVSPRGRERTERTERKVNPVLKQVLELGPTIAFFLIYLRLREESFFFAGNEYSGFIVATILFVPILLAAMGALYFLSGRLSRIQIFTAVMVIFFGALTAWFNDERFFKMKTTLVYGTFALLLGIGLLQGRSYLAFVLSEMLPMEQEGWMILTRRLFLVFILLAAANEFVWRTMSTDTWVKIETFAFPIALVAFLWIQILSMQKYLIEDDE
ncbi:inner membrane-spanning protein YciB [Chachezhania antarctica]|uniref:inner membrane-spanning protein YciB n=1 Tax=Chachezhania antarctica TaxID=2340860 RepID=UPI000EADE921|nr:inner membrane-spanning protein YciB [Chachezhania antarctica]|tara:strand:+ start:16170 stop:16814 length:645 start_codon:yes stop_codon:yes gene_type:complete